MNLLFENKTLPFSSVFLKNSRKSLEGFEARDTSWSITPEQGDSILSCRMKWEFLGIAFKIHGEKLHLSRYPIKDASSISNDFMSLLPLLVSPRRWPHVDHPILGHIQRFVCQNSVKFNDRLSRKEAALILKDLSLCDYPWFCIHGRNSVFPLLKQENPKNL